jgi:2-iminobutanoate/2-iminopropanoate deaminase
LRGNNRLRVLRFGNLLPGLYHYCSRIGESSRLSDTRSQSSDRAMKFPPGAEQPHTLGRRSIRNVVCTSDAPNVIGPYSQAVKGGGFIFVSGQLGLNLATQQIIGGDARQQTKRALQNIAAIFKAAGSNLDKVLRCGVFLKNMNDSDAMNDVYGKIFGPHPPARTTVEAARLPKDSLVQIDALALE